MIKAKYTQNGRLIGFKVVVDGLEIDVGERGLYDPFVMPALIEEGYKYYDYGNNIVMPDGTHIENIISVPFTGNATEYQVMLDSDENVLSEAEACKYFTRETKLTEIQLKEPDVTIETREEFIEYINQLSTLDNRTKFRISEDYRPINSFVAREALFTMSEVQSDPEIRKLFSVLERRRMYMSYDHYMDLLNFLVNKGVLSSVDAPYEKVIEAYYAWGIDGIKTAIVEKKIVDSQSYNDYCERPYNIRSRDNATCIGLMDRKGVLHTLYGSADLSDEEDFTHLEISPVSSAEYFQNLRNSSSWDSDLKPINALCARKRRRVRYMLVDSEDGSRFVVNATSDYIGFYSIQFKDPERFASFSGWYVDMNKNRRLSIDMLRNRNDLLFTIMSASRARELITERIVEPSYSSSFKMCTSNGLTAYCAIRYLGYVSEMAKSSDTELSAEEKVPFMKAAKKFKNGPDANDEAVYNPEGINFPSYEELINYYLISKEKLISEGLYYTPKALIADGGMSAINNSDRVAAIMTRTPDLLNFGRGVLSGEVNAGEFQQSKTDGFESSVARISSFIKLAVKLLYGDEWITNASFDEIIDAIAAVEAKYDMDVIIPLNDGEFYGMMIDTANLLNWKARQSRRYGFVEHIYREISNAPAEKQRHMFAYITYVLHDKVFNECVNAVSDAITRTYGPAVYGSYYNKMAMELTAPYYASEIVTTIRRFYKAIPEITESSGYVYNKKLFDFCDAMPFEISATTIRQIINGIRLEAKYASLSELIANEFEDENGLVYNITFFNAVLSPWYIYSKGSKPIYTYPLAVNYYNKDVLATPLGGANAVESLIKRGVKIDSLYGRFETSFFGDEILSEDWIVGRRSRGKLVLDDQTVNEYYTIADNREYEGTDFSMAKMYNYRIDDPEDAVTKFLYKNKKAKESGNFLYSMSLQSDISFENFGPCYDYEPLLEDDIRVIENADDARCWMFDDKVLQASNVNEISTLKSLSAYRLKPVDIETISYEDTQKFRKVLDGSFKQYGYITLYGNDIKFVGAKELVKNIDDLNREFMEALTEKKFVCKIDQSTYFLRTIYGDYTLEV